MGPRPAWLLGVFGALAASPASAAELSSDAPKDATAPAEDVPAVELTLVAPSARGPWTMRLSNTGDVPMTVVADPRLLELDVVPRGARGPVRCQLPWSMRPVDELERAVLLPPGGAIDESFEPRLYCFTSLGALASGAVVTAHLGAADERGARSGPSIVWPALAGDPAAKPLRTLTAPAIRLPDERVPPPTPASPSPVDEATPQLALLSSETVDALTADDVVVPITLRNEGTSPIIVRFRPESLGFDVGSPGMFEHCAWPSAPTAPTREIFTTLPPKGSEELTVVLSAYCGHSLDQPGLLTVRPWLDTRNGSGASLGLRTFNGVVIGHKSTLVRLQRAKDPGLAGAPHIIPARPRTPANPPLRN